MIKRIIEEYIKRLGIKRYSIISITPLDDVSIISNLPHQWAKDFIKKELHIRSNIIMNAKNRITPFKWTSLNTFNKDINILSVKYGIRNGVTFIIKIKHDTIMFTMYYDEQDKFIKLYSKRKHAILFEVMCIFETYYNKKSRYVFTEREKEVFNLLKFGKTYLEIALVLGVCERTVRFHISNILIKLEVTSVRYAIFKATAEGLI